MLRKATVVAMLVAALVAIPLTVLALTSGRSARLDRQTNAIRGRDITTASTNWRNVPKLTDVLICAQGQVTAMLSANVSGAPVRFRVLYEDGPRLFPARTQFNPGTGTKGFSFTFVGAASTFEGLDGHVYTVQWRSANGSPTILREAVLDLLYQRGTHC
jgi:hypothetical protein